MCMCMYICVCVNIFVGPNPHRKIGKHSKVVTAFVRSVLRTLQAQHNSIPIKAIRASISDDWSSTGFMEAAAELESTGTGHGGVDREKLKEKRDKERQKERAKVEKEKENEDGEYNASTKSKIATWSSCLLKKM